MNQFIPSKASIIAIIKRILSLGIGIFVSFILLAYVVPGMSEVNDGRVIIGMILVVQFLLNWLTLSVTKNMTFGDLFVLIQYDHIDKTHSRYWLILFRSLISASFVYVIFWGVDYAQVLFIILWVIILYIPVIKQGGKRYCAVDLITNSTYTKSTRGYF